MFTIGIQTVYSKLKAIQRLENGIISNWRYTQRYWWIVVMFWHVCWGPRSTDYANVNTNDTSLLRYNSKNLKNNSFDQSERPWCLHFQTSLFVILFCLWEWFVWSNMRDSLVSDVFTDLPRLFSNGFHWQEESRKRTNQIRMVSMSSRESNRNFSYLLFFVRFVAHTSLLKIESMKELSAFVAE